MASGGESTPSHGSESPGTFFEESSSSPNRERRGRGRGRSKRAGSGKRGSRSRSGSRATRSRGSGSRGSRERSRGRGGLHTVIDPLEIDQQRQESMREELSAMSRDKKEDILKRAITRYPSLIFNIMRPAEQRPGGFHPGPGGEFPDWCVSGQCREMPTEPEKVCCGLENCVSLQPVIVTFLACF